TGIQNPLQGFRAIQEVAATQLAALQASQRELTGNPNATLAPSVRRGVLEGLGLATTKSGAIDTAVMASRLGLSEEEIKENRIFGQAGPAAASPLKGVDVADRAEVLAVHAASSV